MNEVEKITFSIGPNKETAEWVNNQHNRMERGTRLLVDIASAIGEVLSKVRGNAPTGAFPEWLEKQIACPKRTADRYISLFNYKNEISGTGSLSEAYKLIETIEAQKKQTETQKAYQRVAEYRKTGKKPEGWRQHTDDKLAKEEEERDARIEAIKQEALNRKNEQQEKERERIEETQKREAERARLEVETDSLLKYLDQESVALKKRAEFKEKIRLSADGMKDPFQDAILDYLDTLQDDSRRIETCYNIIKICKRIAVELQTRKERV